MRQKEWRKGGAGEIVAEIWEGIGREKKTERGRKKAEESRMCRWH